MHAISLQPTPACGARPVGSPAQAKHEQNYNGSKFALIRITMQSIRELQLIYRAFK